MSVRWSALTTIFLAALVLRLGFVVISDRAPDFPDEKDYKAVAQSLLRGEGFREPGDGGPQAPGGRRASRAPGYPAFLAACYAVGLRSDLAIYVLQAIAGAGTCVLISILGRRLYNPVVGGIAGWISAADPFQIFFTGMVLSETLFILFFVLLILLSICVVEDAPRRLLWVALLAGVTAGLAIHVRSSFLLFPLFFLPFWVLSASNKLRTAAAWLVMMAAMVAVLSPWVVRNYRIFGHFIPATLQVGESLYEANSDYADGGPAMDRIPWDKVRGVSMNEYGNNEFFKHAALDYIRAHPKRFVVLAGEKFRRFWNVVPNFSEYRRPFYVVVSVCALAPVLALAVVCLLARRAQRNALWILLAPVCYFTLMHMVFVGSVRYRLVVMPFVMVLAAAGAQWLWESLRVSRGKKAAPHG